jgi:hypothetical protein
MALAQTGAKARPGQTWLPHSPLEKTPHNARVIGVSLMAAVVTLLEMAAENSGPTDLYRGHDAALRRAERSAVLLTIGFAIAAKHIRHLKLGAIHVPGARSIVVERAWAQGQLAAGANREDLQWNTLCWSRCVNSGPW